MKIDEMWIRAHLPEEYAYEPLGDFNERYHSPHWGYDMNSFRFVEISDSKEYSRENHLAEELERGKRGKI